MQVLINCSMIIQADDYTSVWIGFESIWGKIVYKNWSSSVKEGLARFPGFHSTICVKHQLTLEDFYFGNKVTSLFPSKKIICTVNNKNLIM